jgi:hypothetical protein
MYFSFILSYSVAILLTLYIPEDEFLIRNRSHFTNIIILQAKYLFIYLYMIRFCFILNTKHLFVQSSNGIFKTLKIQS